MCQVSRVDPAPNDWVACRHDRETAGYEASVADLPWEDAGAALDSSTACAVLDCPRSEPKMVNSLSRPEPESMPQVDTRENQVVPTESPRRLGVGWLWLTMCLLVAGFFGIRALGSFGDRAPAVALPPDTVTQLVTRNIEEVQLGERVSGNNPEMDDQARVPDPDPATWRRIKLVINRPSGTPTEIEVLRPIAWIEDVGASVGGTIYLNLPEMGAEGLATVQAIDSCPSIQPGEGNVVTGRFMHRPDGELVDVRVEGLASPIGCTVNHPFWSADRATFVPAEELQPGERVETILAGLAKVVAVTQRPDADRVYNIEVHGEHVYHVSDLGVLVHNRCLGRHAPKGPLHGPAPKIHLGKQGKHIPGHNNYQPGKGILRADPEELARHAGTGSSLRPTPVGQPGSRELVDFGKIIGDHVDEVTGAATQTRWGIITYGKDGIHIFPVRPQIPRP